MKSKKSIITQEKNSFLKCVFFCIFISFAFIILLHYVVWFLYEIGNRYTGLPTFLDQEKMLTYITTVLSAISTTALSAIAVYQTYRANEMQNSPRVVISDGNNPFFELNPGLSTGTDCYCMGCKRDRSSFNLLFTILEKSIKKLSVENFIILSENNEKVATFPRVDLPGLEDTIGLIPANKRFFICYGTSEIKQGFTGIASFCTKCQTISGNSYQKNWEIHFALSNQREIIIYDISDGYWKRTKM